MVSVKIKLFANLREHAGKSELMASGDTVLDVLNMLTEQFPPLKEMIFEKECEEPELCGYINVFVNGNSIHHLDGLSTRLEEDDEIAIFPPVSGG
ncbi:MAG: MoaD/ThiS family protein [Methanosarcinaceae archaeon]|nr:MoaD/ThiS family protein [Methanosarcinaceae archaeon]